MLQGTQNRRDDITDVQVIQVELRENVRQCTHKVFLEHDLRSVCRIPVAHFLAVDVEANCQQATTEFGEHEKRL